MTDCVGIRLMVFISCSIFPGHILHCIFCLFIFDHSCDLINCIFNVYNFSDNIDRGFFSSRQRSFFLEIGWIPVFSINLSSFWLLLLNYHHQYHYDHHFYCSEFYFFYWAYVISCLNFFSRLICLFGIHSHTAVNTNVFRLATALMEGGGVILYFCDRGDLW